MTKWLYSILGVSRIALIILVVIGPAVQALGGSGHSYVGPILLKELVSLVKVNCAECGKDIMKYPSRLKKGKKYFCNLDCRKRYNSVDMQCELCGKPITVYNCRVGKNKYCSKKCGYLGRSTTLRSKSKRGPRNPCWKGGRFKNGHGYWMINIIILTEVQLENIKGMHRYGSYVLEHRMLMAESIGRPLRSDEVVHHINGRKDDNRLENLQLLTKNTHSHGNLYGRISYNVECPRCGLEFECNAERNKQ